MDPAKATLERAKAMISAERMDPEQARLTALEAPHRKTVETRKAVANARDSQVFFFSNFRV